MVKRKIPSMCRPPPKPPDRQSSLTDKANKRILLDIDPKGRPLTKPLDIHYANEELFTGPSQAPLHTTCQWRSDRDN